MPEVNGDHIETLVRAILNERSSATAKHVKKVISAIFSHARRIGVFTGTNPATLARPITVTGVREQRALSFEETKRLIDALPSGPKRAREMVTLCVSTSMNISEVRGLLWKHLNLTDDPVSAGTKLIPPRHLSVREHYYRNERGSLKTGGRLRDIPLSDELVEMLQAVRRTSCFRDDNHPRIRVPTWYSDQRGQSTKASDSTYRHRGRTAFDRLAHIAAYIRDSHEQFGRQRQ